MMGRMKLRAENRKMGKLARKDSKLDYKEASPLEAEAKMAVYEVCVCVCVCACVCVRERDRENETERV